MAKAIEKQPGEGVDLSLIRELLALTPVERLRRAVEEARNVAKLDRKLKR
ncbi:MAG TPA: hypothetical protein VF698_20755 [Thermoanaerobaculia bacterium]|jgi:hypothetical protein